MNLDNELLRWALIHGHQDYPDRRALEDVAQTGRLWAVQVSNNPLLFLGVGGTHEERVQDALGSAAWIDRTSDVMGLEMVTPVDYDVCLAEGMRSAARSNHVDLAVLSDWAADRGVFVDPLRGDIAADESLAPWGVLADQVWRLVLRETRGNGQELIDRLGASGKWLTRHLAREEWLGKRSRR